MLRQTLHLRQVGHRASFASGPEALFLQGVDDFCLRAANETVDERLPTLVLNIKIGIVVVMCGAMDTAMTIAPFLARARLATASASFSYAFGGAFPFGIRSVIIFSGQGLLAFLSPRRCDERRGGFFKERIEFRPLPPFATRSR